ncbi:hypothetical protein AMK20_32670 [Streptomyces sp. TSRI0261]|nr:hypothetical protein AMK20_32670 [Streptomyces sp. TSRI0261]
MAVLNCLISPDSPEFFALDATARELIGIDLKIIYEAAPQGRGTLNMAAHPWRSHMEGTRTSEDGLSAQPL